MTKSTILLLLFVAALSGSAMGVTSFRRGLGNMKGQWPPERPARLSDSEKLKLIRQLSPFPAPASPQPREDVCYTPECLDAALALLKSINFSVDPCQDFFQYTCGRWMAENPIPDTASEYSHFNILVDMVNNITQGILTSPKQEGDFKPVNQTKDFYATCIDLDALETAGLNVILEHTSSYGGWPSVTPDWDETSFAAIQTIADVRRVFADPVLVRVVVSQDLKNTDRSVIYLDQGDFFLPRLVLLDQVTYKDFIDATVKYYIDAAKELAGLTGALVTEEQLEIEAREMLAFETELAKISAADEDRGNVTRIYNPRKLDAYEAETGFMWKDYLDQLFSSSGLTIAADEDVIVLELDYLSKIVSVTTAVSPRIVANYVYWRLVSGLASETTQRMRDIKFEFDQVTSGLAEQSPREQVCSRTSQNIFGMAIGVKYVEEAFDIAAKDNVDKMVNNLRTAFKDLLVIADWLDDETRAKAAEKADKMRQFMAFPDWLYNQTRLEMEYAGAELVDGKYLDSVLSLSQWSSDAVLKTLREVTDKDIWIMYPGVVNAGYSPELNSITFPAGILAPPFYRVNGPESLNYGGIGVVIGHEITHGFDDQGSQYDGDGNAENWWSEAILEKFLEKAQCIVDQYGAYTVPGADGQPLHLNGDLTSGENIADNGGVRQSYLAYQTWIESNNGGVPEKRLPGLESLTPNQLFFIGYGNIWCENIRANALINQVNTDPHSPSQYRVIGPVQNSQEFSDQFQCPAGSPMNPADKCVLW